MQTTRESLFLDIFVRKDLLLWDATFQKVLCLCIPVPASLPQQPFLADRSFEEPRVLPCERQKQGFIFSSAHKLRRAPPPAASLLTDPPTEKSFSQQARQEADSSAAEQWVAWLYH